MAQHIMHIDQDFDVDNLAGFNHCQYLNEDTSTTSSPSPIMWQLAHSYTPQIGDVSFELYHDHRAYPYIVPAQTKPIVEFTDLTAPYDKDDRHEHTQTKDKQATSCMYMRRRAQNRASQRAFRERKEKHAQDLQRQLNELYGKHQILRQSYDELASTNKNLASELGSLKCKILAIQASQGAVNNLPKASKAESLDGDDQLNAANEGI